MINSVIKTLFATVAVVAIGLVAYNYLGSSKVEVEPVGPAASSTQNATTTDVLASAEIKPVEPVAATPVATPEPVVKAPRLAPPGIFYLKTRIAFANQSGLHKINAGTRVNLMQRKGEWLKVTDGKVDFEVRESQTTRDLDLAEELQRQPGTASTGSAAPVRL